MIPASNASTLEDEIASISSIECLPSNCSLNSSMSVEDTSGSKVTQAVNDKNTVQIMDAETAGSGNFQSNLQEGLIAAKDTVEQLNSALQTLKETIARKKMLEKRVFNSIHEAFIKLCIALKKRKLDLITGLKAVSEINVVGLQNAVKDMEKQKECLQSRITFVESAQPSPLVAVYCERSSLVRDLKTKIVYEGALDSLKDSPDISFDIDIDAMLKTFESLGKVSSAECQTKPSANEAVKKYPCLDVTAEDRNTRGQLQDCAKGFSPLPCEFDFGYMKMDEHKMDTSKWLAPKKYFPKDPLEESSPILLKNNSLPQTLSSPDVIIEEIIEEDQPCMPAPQNHKALSYIKGKALKIEMTDRKPKRLKKSQKMTAACAPFSQTKYSQELVYISQLTNPCNFYVHRYTQKRHMIMLDRMLITLSSIGSKCCATDVLQLGELVAFNSIAHNKWCRGSITELIPLESKCILKPCGPTRYKIEDVVRLTLFLLDYGGSETFVAARFSGGYRTKSDPAKVCGTKIDNLHKILIKLSSAEEDNFRFMPPFAIHCSLDLVPQSPGGLWTKEVNDHILKAVGKKCVSMKTLREEHNKLIVDLKTPFDNKIKSDMPVSLRDYLVLSEMAKFPSNISTGLNNTAINCYKDPILPEHASEAVLICHVNNPSDFYIQLVSEKEYRSTVDKMQEVYNSRGADDWQILCPVLGEACVAKYESEEDWYRAEIMDLLSAQEAIIKYVDFGNISKVNISGLRTLKEEFMALPIQAIGCRLAYIQPHSAGQWWTSEACKMFEALVCNKVLKCSSIGVLLEKKLSVELFEESLSTVTSINTILVERNVAAFISCSSDFGDNSLPLMEVWDPVLDLSSDSVEECMDNISLSERKELDVFISHVVSPSKIYTQWLTTENILKGLQASLYDRYENSEPEAVQWQVNMQVAVQTQSEKKWMRGKVTDISDSLVQVFCYDYGMLEVTEVTYLRTLDKSLMVYGTMCLECSLMDIQPAGGSQTWTATACEFVNYYLSGAVVTLIIEENASLWPVPVRILIKNEAGKKVDVSEALVTKGLALRNRRLKPHKSLLETSDKSTSICESDLKLHDPKESITSDSPPLSTKKVLSEPSNAALPEKPAMEPIVDEPYLPPVLPDENTFSAKVSHVGDDGIIYVIQECFENELGVLMVEIQNSFKCLGLMAPYTWKKGEGCIIKGSDTMSYRGKVLDILGGDRIKVQYEDFGYTEKIPKCHLYPSVHAPHLPGFCIPCQLNDILPVGDHWQVDAIQFLKELLKERLVTVHTVEPPKYPHGIASVRIYCGNTPVSDILKIYNYGIPKGCERNHKIETNCITKCTSEKIWKIDCQELLQNDMETPLLPYYSPTPLPRPGELFEVKVTHFITPNKVFICIKNISGDNDPLKSILHDINSDFYMLPSLTDFRTAMPCLAFYGDGALHRAKLQAIKSYDPVTCLVEFVDYGTPKVLDISSLFQLPPSLIEYPAKAIKVKLAGFRPAKEDSEKLRLPYCPDWSLEALYQMMDLVQGKTLFATYIAGSENSVFLYDDSQQLVHKPLIEKKLAEIEEM
ncbi:RING finger protein 17 [Anomaloglossus baeobatrachus]|uniref:RING finger protein 17 n=1 Tax=Anomaloglossus baeobatrachus TaxID=238106 RepID=UPI003F5067F5